MSGDGILDLVVLTGLLRFPMLICLWPVQVILGWGLKTCPKYLQSEKEQQNRWVSEIESAFPSKEIQCFFEGPSPPTSHQSKKIAQCQYLICTYWQQEVQRCPYQPVSRCLGEGNHCATILHIPALFGFGCKAQGPPWWSELFEGTGKKAKKTTRRSWESVVVWGYLKKCMKIFEVIWKRDKTQQMKEPWTFSWIICHFPFVWSQHVKMIKINKNGYVLFQSPFSSRGHKSPSANSRCLMHDAWYHFFQRRRSTS